jgi:hypothetical protein
MREVIKVVVMVVGAAALYLVQPRAGELRRGTGRVTDRGMMTG